MSPRPVSLRRAPAPAPCNCDGLAELVDYLNDRIDRLGAGVGEPHFSAQAARLVLRGPRVETEVGPFLLRTEAHRLAPVIAPSRIGGWYSALSVVTRSGRALDAETPLRLQASDAAAVAMDRLYRVLHMINHLGCARERTDLWVHTSLRHVLAVEGRHGAFFEELLKRCGLGAERIVLIVPLLPADDADFARLAQACDEYASRGFRLALDLGVPTPDTARALAILEPDFVRVRERDLAALRALGVHTRALVRDLGRVAASAPPFAATDLIEMYERHKPVFLS
ncbi:MAG TPA: hypothetical protein PJ986_14190 [Gammaproteobacteria bacterium]|nr:hypothetical protein [Gammaproteobacteria bacterium]